MVRYSHNMVYKTLRVSGNSLVTMARLFLSGTCGRVGEGDWFNIGSCYVHLVGELLNPLPRIVL